MRRIVINYSTNKSFNNHYRIDNAGSREPNRAPLLGKAVLLIGNDTAVIQSLVMQLAQKGADIAVMCWQLPVETARWLYEQVQALGRKLFLMEQAHNQGTPLTELVHRIAAEWGQFDIFIDVSAKPGESVNGRMGEVVTNQPRYQPAWPSDQWRLAQIVLQEMIRN